MTGDQGGSVAGATGSSDDGKRLRRRRSTPYDRPPIRAADTPRRLFRVGRRLPDAPLSDPSIAGSADAPQPILSGDHPLLRRSPRLRSPSSAPSSTPLTRPVFDPPPPLTRPVFDPPPPLTRPVFDPPLPITGPKLGLFSVDAPAFKLHKAQDTPLTTEAPTKSKRSYLLGPPPPEGPPGAEYPSYGNYCGEPVVCLICNRERDHWFPECPFMLLATQVYKATPPRSFEYRSYHAQYEDVGIPGFGYAFYFKGGAKRSAAEAARLQKQDGLNLVKITDYPQETTSDPEQLYKVFKAFGPVTHVLTFPHYCFGFVGFVSEEGAETAMRNLNSSGGYGRLTLAHELRG